MSTSQLIGDSREQEAANGPKPHLWNRDDYHRLGEKGFFDTGSRVELIEGVIYDKYPPSGGPAPHRWTRREYYRMAKLGFFGDYPHVELIRGEIYDKVSPQASPHTTAVRKVSVALERLFGAGHEVRYQFLVVMADNSEPEPDVVALSRPLEAYAHRHPRASDVLLLVEVSDSTLAFDRKSKAALYAFSGIAEYWIVNLKARRVEVYRDSTPDGYVSTTIHGADTSIGPLNAPNATIAVADLLP